MEPILSPYSQSFKKELNFYRKLLLIDKVCDSLMDATKSTSITITRGVVEVTNINMSKADLLALGNFLLDKYK